MVGNIPNYNKIDVLRCFFRLSRYAGRQELAKELHLGEGTVRTILGILKSKKMLSSAKKGHFLSKKGEYELGKIMQTSSMPELIAAKNPYPDYIKIGMRIKNVPALSQVHKIRDIAVKNGADGAIILRFQNGLYAPEAGIGQDFRELENNFDFKKNDVFVIGFSNSRKNAENGALSIAVELSSSLKKFINLLSG